MPVYTSNPENVILGGSAGTIVAPSTCCTTQGSNGDVTIFTLSLTTDGVQAIPAGLLVVNILVECSDGLSAFTCGTTGGNQSVIASTIIEASTLTPFVTAVYFPSAGNLWFSGITSPTDIKIYAL